MNRNVILGRDWLKTYKVRLYYDLGCLRLNKTYVALQEDIHIASIIRVISSTKLEPQTAKVCWARAKNNIAFPDDHVYQISPLERGYIFDEPGIMIANSVGTLRKGRKIGMLVVNNTNKTVHLRRGCVAARISPVDVSEIASVSTQGHREHHKHPSEHISKHTHTLGPHFNRNLGPKHTSGPETVRKENQIELSEIQTPPEHANAIRHLVGQNTDLFAKGDLDLGRTQTVKMKIDTGDAKPIKLRPYRAPLNNRKVIDDAVKEMLDAGIIRRSHSPWAFPVVVVPKKDGTKRFCVDFRQLNKVTKKNSFPLPLIDDFLSQLKNATHFSTLDLKSGYWQVAMDEADIEKTAFTCHTGLFEFGVMPFGLVNAPSVFQQLMADVLQGLDFCFAYIDDILIFSKSFDEHLSHIEQVFDRLRQHGLKLKLKKCAFAQEETKYLGFVINRDGIKPDQDKVEAIRAMRSPTCVKHVRSFIGMCSYYRRFLPNFSELASPLIALTKKYSRWKWTPECQQAFDRLKKHLTSIPLLAYPNLQKSYILYTDASDKAIGACLTQPCDPEDSFLPGIKGEIPIHFISHKLSDTQTRWSTIEREAFAIHYALQRLDHYLHDAEFVIRTDHKPLRYLLESPMQNKKVQLWALGIAGYNCTIEYIPGKANTCADLLSRPVEAYNTPNDEAHVEPDINDNTLQVNALNSNTFNPKAFASYQPEIEETPDPEKSFSGFDMRVEQNRDSELSSLKSRIQKGTAASAQDKRHILLDDLLYYISHADDQPTLRLYIPQHLRQDVLTQFHDKNGHMGLDKTFDTMKPKYYWPNLYKEISEYITKCVTCQQRCLRKQRAPMQETDSPPYPFAKVGLDLAGPYSTTLSGNRYIATFVDWYSGWPEAFPIPDKRGDTIAHLISQELFPKHGAVLSLVTDNGSEFENKSVKETLAELNIEHITTTFYHPQSNAKVERFHRTLNDVLAKMVQDNVTTWDLVLNQALAAIRFNVSESSKYSPFFLLYNRDVVLPLDNLLRPRKKYLGEEHHKIALEQQHKVFLAVHRHMKRAKRKNAKYMDRQCTDTPFEVGDLVYYKNFTKTSKLQSNWKPYFRIIEKKGPVSFIIKDQLTARTIKAHAEQLRLAHLDEWDIPKDKLGRTLRRAAYAVPPESDDSDSDIGSDSEDTTPLQRIVKMKRHERDASSDEDDIPLMELSKRLKERKQRETEMTEMTRSASDDSEPEPTTDATIDDPMDDIDPVPDVMDVDMTTMMGQTHNDQNLKIKSPSEPPETVENATPKLVENLKSAGAKQKDLQNLFTTIANMLA